MKGLNGFGGCRGLKMSVRGWDYCFGVGVHLGATANNPATLKFKKNLNALNPEGYVVTSPNY